MPFHAYLLTGDVTTVNTLEDVQKIPRVVYYVEQSEHLFRFVDKYNNPEPLIFGDYELSHAEWKPVMTQGPIIVYVFNNKTKQLHREKIVEKTSYYPRGILNEIISYVESLAKNNK